MNEFCSMWILGTPIKSKKETVEEDVAGYWNALWATSCLWLWQNLQTLLVCVCAGCWHDAGLSSVCSSYRGCALALHPPVHLHTLSTPGLGIICFIQMESSREPTWWCKDELSKVKAFPPKQSWIFVLPCSIFLPLCKTFLKCLYIILCSSAECKITSWCLL